MEGTTVIASGLHEVTKEWMHFAQERVEHNLNHLERLRNYHNLHDCMALQTQIVRDNLQAFLESAQRTSERSTRIARSAVDRMTAPLYSSTMQSMHPNAGNDLRRARMLFARRSLSAMVLMWNYDG